LLFWEHAAISPIRDRDGTITHYLGIKEDITEKKKLEEQLRQAQKMEAIGQLAGGVAHDFNNILSAITGYASLLEMSIPSDETLRDYIAEISVASERGALLTQSLLAFSRKQEATLTVVDLNDQVRSSHKILSRLVGEDVDLVLDLDREDMVVEADTGQLQQALMNLTSNARDAMPNGGTLRIATRNITIESDHRERYSLERPRRYALLTVTDTGIGMEQEIREHVFEPFYTTKGVGKGTGLGLAIVYGMVQKHKGSITVDSEPGKGTVFSIYLPLTERSVRGRGMDANLTPAAAGNKTILVVEDEEQVRRVIRLTLEAYGYHVIEACDGEDAVRVFRDNKDEVMLVLCDLIMPKKNGRAACEEMKGIRPDIKTIFMSGYTKDIFDQKGISETDITLLVKPINPKELVKKIGEELEGTQRRI
jgi:two-component system NtrC family sensor kinase